ncbi:transcription antitermination regulator [Mycobacterium sp. 1274761.0]|nr:PAS and ANTAR domain-containing protein [Mycobacterium sp. 1274761.0]OBK74158.1 transcription antitermination regulator [Mycobacterium sp. 1274761.0]
MRSCSADADNTAIRPTNRVGAFRYFRDDDRWEWSDAVARMHGYAPSTVEPTTALVLSHKHPDDAAKVAQLIDAMAKQGDAFSSRHRIVDTAGRTHSVLVVAEQLRGDDGAVVGSQGFYVDLSDIATEETMNAAIADFTKHRSQIEQAKGILMAVYGISAEHAFDIMVWRSQETNTKLRKLVGQIVEDYTGRLNIPADVRARADQLLLTAHQRVAG